ncbi:MAG: hypothetical protein VKI42_10510 [Synechococcaceae cyanobacterium]|jgi:hypothetical protein|nr:hypothetical protein [Synechococcaceae cyanobacterium]
MGSLQRPAVLPQKTDTSLAGSGYGYRRADAIAVVPVGALGP